MPLLLPAAPAGARGGERAVRRAAAGFRERVGDGERRADTAVEVAVVKAGVSAGVASLDEVVEPRRGKLAAADAPPRWWW